MPERLIAAEGRVEIIVGDCRDVMRDMAPDSIDAVVTDPPYQQTSLAWDRWQEGWPNLAARVLKPTGSMWVFGSLRMFTDRWSDFDAFQLAQDVIWEKHNGSSFHADRFRRVHEQAAHFYRAGAKFSDVYRKIVTTADATKRTTRRKKRPAHMGHIEAGAYTSEDGGPRMARSVIFCRSEHGRAVHPTQKPVGVVAPLVEHSCPPGGVLLDPFGGSGTTALAAQHAGRVILIEACRDYALAAQDRIERERTAGPLFAGGPHA
jgi:site-specific DNA-methyltransferase (adenine-specific)